MLLASLEQGLRIARQNESKTVGALCHADCIRVDGSTVTLRATNAGHGNQAGPCNHPRGRFIFGFSRNAQTR